MCNNGGSDGDKGGESEDFFYMRVFLGVLER
jgi:condensin-2 complex subunit D3